MVRDMILTPVNFNGIMIGSRKAELDFPSCRNSSDLVRVTKVCAGVQRI